MNNNLKIYPSTRLVIVWIISGLLGGCQALIGMPDVEPNTKIIFDPQIAYLIVGVQSDSYSVNNIMACRGQTGFSCLNVFLPTGAQQGVYVIRYPVNNKPTRFAAIFLGPRLSNIRASAGRPDMRIDKPGIYYFGMINVKSRTDKPGLKEQFTSTITGSRHLGYVSVNHMLSVEIIEAAKRKYSSVFNAYKLFL